MPNTTTAAGAASFAIPSGTDVYDALMGDIDLDLVSVNLPRLDAMYPNETPAEHDARMKRYAAAFEKYAIAFNNWTANFQIALAAVRHETLKLAEKNSRNEEEKTLSTLEIQFDSPSAT